MAKIGLYEQTAYTDTREILSVPYIVDIAGNELRFDIKDIAQRVFNKAMTVYELIGNMKKNLDIAISRGDKTYQSILSTRIDNIQRDFENYIRDMQRIDARDSRIAKSIS